MFAVVLVGGFGTRLRPLTNDVPKPMLPVMHRPMIVRLVERLALGGVTDVVLALGFKPGPFQTAFPDGSHGDVRVHYAVEPEPLDTAGAIKFAAHAVGVNDTFVVANGDIITDLSISDLVAAHRSFGGEATLHLTPIEDPSAFGVVEIESDGAITRFIEKPKPGETSSTLISAGTYVLEPTVLGMIPPSGPVSVERSTFPQLVDKGLIYGHPTDDYWLDTGRPSQYLQANLDYIRGNRGPALHGRHPSARIDPAAVVIDSVVGPHVTIGAGARVSGSLLIGTASIGPDATVESSIVMGAVGDSATVIDCVQGADHVVDAHERVNDRLLPPPD